MKPKDTWILGAIAGLAYEIMENGEVWKLNHSGQVAPRRQLKVHQHPKTGYLYFTMSFRNVQKCVLVHRVVALVHLPNPDDLPAVNHKDGNKSHNWKENLEWMSNGDNEKHAYKIGLKTRTGEANSQAKLCEDDVRAIRTRYPSESAASLASEFSISHGTIGDIVRRRSWGHVC